MQKTTRDTIPVKIGNNITIGGASNRIIVQSMTNTNTADVSATVAQIIELAKAGSEIVRITVNNHESALAVPAIKENLFKAGCDVPIVGDFHYNGHILLSKFPECAKLLDKYRINPGNVGSATKRDKRDRQFLEIIEIAILHNKPIRIGVNWGSLDEGLLTQLMDENSALKNPLSSEDIYEEAMLQSVLESCKMAREAGLAEDKIIISCKVSKVDKLVSLYQKLAVRCKYPLHIGLTEAGMGEKGVVSSAVALGILLNQSIGDTIRVSLTPKPDEPRTKEVLIAKEILQALGLRQFAPKVTACPGCGRTTSKFFQELALDIENFLKKNMPIWQKKYKGVENLELAVMGCVVNGPGESKHADIGISLPGLGEAPKAPVFIDGKHKITLEGAGIATKFQQITEDYIKNRWGKTKDA